MDKVDREVAEQDFERFAEMMGLDLNPADMSDEDKASLELQKNRVLFAIQKGWLVINEDGEPVFTPQRSEKKDPITFHEPTGATMQAMDRRKKNEDVGKTYAALADMTGRDAKTFSKMKMGDLKICLAVFTLYTG